MAAGAIRTFGDESEHAVNQLSAGEQQKNRVRLSEIRAIAIRNRRAIEILREANGAFDR